jgi:hypothetical protein
VDFAGLEGEIHPFQYGRSFDGRLQILDLKFHSASSAVARNDDQNDD